MTFHELTFVKYVWPVSILMFSTFEHSVDFLYRKVIQTKKEDCSRAQQLAVTCVAGYASGTIGTIVSNPADNIVASLYNKKAESIVQVTSPYKDVLSQSSLCLLSKINHSNALNSQVIWLDIKYSSHTLQAVKKIGLLNLFTRSLPIRITLVGPVVTLQWFFYDTIKVLTGLYVSLL